MEVEYMRHLTREYKGGYSIKNNNISLDCDEMHVYRLDDSRYGISYDKSFTKKIFPNFKTAREYAIKITSKRA